MNRERLEKLAEWLENGAQSERVVFDMATGATFKVAEDFNPNKPTDCETSCCLAGAAVQFNDPAFYAPYIPRAAHRYDHEYEMSWPLVRDRALDLLGLEYEDGRKLFTPWEFFDMIEDEDDDGDFGPYPRGEQHFNDPAWAARTIRHLLATGEVDWDATKAEEA